MQQQTKKKQRKTLLSIPSDYRKLLFQPNHITNSQYSYTLMQERVFTYLIYHLHTYTLQVMNGDMISQLDLFTAVGNKDYVDISIPLNMIAKPYQYNEVRTSTLKMITVPIRVLVKDRYGKDIERVESLITHVDIAKEERKRTSFLNIRMSKAVASLLLNIERRDGTPVNYTSFLFGVALTAENKYTPRLYKLLSSWRTKELYRTKIENLREFLQLGTKYSDYEALKRRILIPVINEINERACEENGFTVVISESRVGKKTTHVNFVLKPTQLSDKETEYKLWSNIFTKLRRAFGVDDTGLQLVQRLKGKHSPIDVNNKIMFLFEYMHRPDVINNPGKRIDDPDRWVLRSLFREFPAE